MMKSNLLIILFGGLCLLSFIRIHEDVLKTSLTVTVRDDAGNTVEGATIQLFEREDDYKAENNAVAKEITDNKGVARLKELKAIVYYVLVQKGDKDNINWKDARTFESGDTISLDVTGAGTQFTTLTGIIRLVWIARGQVVTP